MFGLKKLLNEMQFSDEESQKTLLQLFYFAGCFDEPLLKHSLAFSGFDEFQIQLMTLTIQHAMKTTDFKSIDNFQHDIISTSPHFLASEFDDETEFNKTKTWCSILLAQLKSQQALLLSTFEKEIDAMIEAGRKATTYQLASSSYDRVFIIGDTKKDTDEYQKEFDIMRPQNIVIENDIQSGSFDQIYKQLCSIQEMQQFILRTGPYAVSVLKNIHLLIICHHDHIDTYQKEIDNIFYNNQTIKFEIIAGDTVKSTPQDLLNVILQKTQPYLNEKNLHLLETKIAEESLPPLIIESVDPAETNTNNSIVPYTVGVAAIAALGAMQLPPGTKQLILQKAGETAGWTLEKGKNIGAATLQFGAEWGFFAAKKTGELLLNGATTTANYAKEYMNRK